MQIRGQIPGGSIAKIDKLTNIYFCAKFDAFTINPTIFTPICWTTTTEEREAALTGMITSARINKKGHIHFTFDVTPRFKTYNDNNNNNNNGLLTDPLGDSSLLKYINYN